MIKDLHVQGLKTLLEQFSNVMLNPPQHTTEDIKKVNDLVMLLIGDRDQGSPIETAIELYRLIPNAELAVIPDVDHSVCRKKPDILAPIALDFLLRHS